jgi:GTP-dependent phosphoenolpyruvate carboxykinase
VDVTAWRQETERNAQFLAKFGRHMPKALLDEHQQLSERLAASGS